MSPFSGLIFNPDDGIPRAVPLGWDMLPLKGKERPGNLLGELGEINIIYKTNGLTEGEKD